MTQLEIHPLQVSSCQSMSSVAPLHSLALSTIISKVLANRMCLVMENIMSKPQNTFVRDRQILNSVLIVNECVDDRLRDRFSDFFCK